MLNRVIIMGRITHELEIKQTQNGTACLSFSVAVERNFKNANGSYDADFINCVAWKNTAEFIGRYFGKGRMIAIEGQLRCRTYEDKNGTKHYVTEVYVDSASFTGEKTSQDVQSTPQNGFNNAAWNSTAQASNAQQSGAVYVQAQKSGSFIGGTEPPPNMRNNGSQSIGDLSEFEDVLSDEGVPF